MGKFFGQVSDSTRACFVRGETISDAIITGFFVDDTKTILVADQTPFHPVVSSWPDQPGDKGQVFIQNQAYPILDTVLWPIKKFAPITSFNPEINVRRNDPEFVFVVAHILKDFFEHPESLLKKRAVLEVDKAYRKSLSVTHSASHLLDFALNKILHHYWKKPVELDLQGNYNTSKIAIVSSRITPFESLDTYSLPAISGKGFNAEKFISEHKKIQDLVEQVINDWIQKNAKEPIQIQANGDKIDSTRQWVTRLDGKKISMFCGGTHPLTIGEIGEIKILLTLDTSHFQVKTTIVQKLG